MDVAVAMHYPLAVDRRRISLQAKRGVGRNDVLDSAADFRRTIVVARRLDAEIEWGTTGAPVRAEMAPHTVDLAPRSCPKSVQPGLGMGGDNKLLYVASVPVACVSVACKVSDLRAFMLGFALEVSTQSVN